MDLNFTYSDNTSPNFAGIFSRAYERVNERREQKKSAATEPAKTKETPAPAPEPAPAWNPYGRARKANEAHAQQTKTAAEAVQTYTGRASRATDGKPQSRTTVTTNPRQFDPSRTSRRALPYQGEGPMNGGQPSEMGKHAKPQNPSEVLGRHASGPPPKYETKPVRPGFTGRHAR